MAEEYAPGDSTYDQFKGYGFEAGETVFMFSPHFSLEEMQAAQYGSTYDEPKPLRIELEKDIAFNVVIQTVTAKYVGARHSVSDSSLGCYKHPDWYVEGWLLKSGFDPFPDITRVRFYLRSEASGALDEGFIQVIPKNPDSNGPILYTESP